MDQSKFDLLGWAVAAVAERRREARARRGLNQLSPHLLRDIGLRRDYRGRYHPVDD